MSAVSEIEVVGTRLQDIYGSYGMNKERVDAPNRDFTKPASGHWIRWRLKAGIAFALELGRTGSNGTDRQPGVLSIEVFGPTNKGSRDVTLLADAIGNLFRRQRFTISNGQIVFKVPTVQQMDDKDASDYRVLVTIPYNRDTAV